MTIAQAKQFVLGHGPDDDSPANTIPKPFDFLASLKALVGRVQEAFTKVPEDRIPDFVDELLRRIQVIHSERQSNDVGGDANSDMRD
jgi:hypothetical protein